MTTPTRILSRRELTEPQYTGADVICPHCARRVPDARLTYQAIAEREAAAVAEETGAPLVELLRRDRGRAAARARWLLWTRLRERHGWPLGRIAKVCGNFDPAAVLKALQTLAREKEGTA